MNMVVLPQMGYTRCIKMFQDIINKGGRAPDEERPEDLNKYINFIMKTPYAFYLACTYTQELKAVGDQSTACHTTTAGQCRDL